ncbi:hypothetical protein COLO4_19692 [Corchorus olitorius]|uniref:Uncharacterized protein n=1 Tax=Corchorus olitorius TaxID=93759 RepID=A0A1R3J3Z8_9ROSI|nr:hypothetical protein COLO4_19692 [Corchorus olitorius]
MSSPDQPTSAAPELPDLEYGLRSPRKHLQPRMALLEERNCQLFISLCSSQRDCECLEVRIRKVYVCREGDWVTIEIRQGEDLHNYHGQ